MSDDMQTNVQNLPVGEEPADETNSAGRDTLQPALARSEENIGGGNEDGVVNVINQSVPIDDPEEGVHEPGQQ